MAHPAAHVALPPIEPGHVLRRSPHGARAMSFGAGGFLAVPLLVALIMATGVLNLFFLFIATGGIGAYACVEAVMGRIDLIRRGMRARGLAAAFLLGSATILLSVGMFVFWYLDEIVRVI